MANLTNIQYLEDLMRRCEEQGRYEEARTTAHQLSIARRFEHEATRTYVHNINLSVEVPLETTPKRSTGMNYSTVVFLVSPSVRAVSVSYETKEEKTSGRQFYTFKTFDASIKKDDLVIVPTDTRHKFTVVKVEEVDIDIDLDDATTQFKWIAGKVDLSGYADTLAQEAAAVEKIKSAEKRKKREDLKKSLLDNLGADESTLLIGVVDPAAETAPPSKPAL